MDTSSQVVSEHFGWDPSAPGAWVAIGLWAVIASYGTFRAFRRSGGWIRMLSIAACWLIPLLGAALVIALLWRTSQRQSSVEA